MPISTARLDAIINELLPVLRGDRMPNEFLFDPETLTAPGTIRDYYVEYLRWLGVSQAVLPSNRFYIHANRPCPANLEFRTSPDSGEQVVSLFVDSSLYRSIDALKMALAHEFTHLCLLRHGLQWLPRSATRSLPEDEEIRTDVASIVLGFGTLVMNGVSDYARLCQKDGYAGQLGYLSVPRFAYVYKKVNSLVGVEPATATNGLNPSARKAVRAA